MCKRRMPHEYKSGQGSCSDKEMLDQRSEGSERLSQAGTWKKKLPGWPEEGWKEPSPTACSPGNRHFSLAARAEGGEQQLPPV